MSKDCLFVLVGGFVCLTVAQAQERDIVSGEAILFQDIPAVYGASKYEQKLSEAPAAVSIVTSDDINKYGYRNLADILRSVTGFYTSNDRAYTYGGVRGFQRPGDYNGRILLLIDGYRINDNIFDQAYLGNESIVNVDMIDRVEFIRGPGSSLYGANAFFATINVITKRGRDLKGAELTAEAGSFHSYRGHVAYGDKFEDGTEVLMAASRYNSRGQTYYFPELDDPANNNGLSENADREKYRNLFAKFSTRDFTLEAGHISRDKALPTGVYGTLLSDPGTHSVDPQLEFINLKYEHDISPESRIMARLGYNSYAYTGDYVYSGYLSREQDDGRWWISELQLTQKLGESHKLVAGVEQQNNTRQEQNSYDITNSTVSLADNRRSTRHAMYLQDEYHVRNDLLVYAGVRYDKYKSFGGTTNPRLGLIHSVGDKTTLKLLYGRAFRAPNVYEQYYNDAGAAISSQKGNPDLKPETIETYEFVAEHSLGAGLRSAVSVYRYDVKNLITQVTDPVDSLDVFRNTGKITSHGVEFEIDGRLTPRIDGRASYAIQHSKDADTGEALTNSPRQLAKVNLNTPVIERKVFVGLEVQATSRRKTVQGDDAEGFAVVNATVFSRRWIKNVEASVGAYNLLDRHYGDPVSSSYTQNTIEQDGRSYRLKVKYEF